MKLEFQKLGRKMRQKAEGEAVEVGKPTRRGFPIYDENPSVVAAMPTRIVPRKTSRLGSAYMVAPGTGEVVAKGSFGFVEETEVDNEKFVKVYLEGIRQYGQLSKAGALLFEFVYRQISGMEGRDRDTVSLNHYIALKWKPDLPRSTYYRGMNELLEKEFLFRSAAADVYFVNVRFMFNGDRLVVVKAYRRKGSTMQAELPFDGPAQLDGPE